MAEELLERLDHTLLDPRVVERGHADGLAAAVDFRLERETEGSADSALEVAAVIVAEAEHEGTPQSRLLESRHGAVQLGEADAELSVFVPDIEPVVSPEPQDALDAVRLHLAVLRLAEVGPPQKAPNT
jgi:hypothetical protein